MSQSHDLHDVSAGGSGTITVVSGLPRSGTSMMMRILEVGGVELLSDGAREADEDNPKGYHEYEPVKGLHRGKHDWLRVASGKAVKIVSPLLRFLPREYQYKIVFMQRKMEEILASQRIMLARRGEIADRYGDRKMADIYENDLRQIELWMGNNPSVTALFVNYNGLLQEPLPALCRVNEFFDGTLDIDAMTAVIERDLYRQRR